MSTNGTLRADLHVHSVHSERPSEWILKTLGTRESYTDPELIYRSAVERGMGLVTVTDHNRLEGALLLKERYPDRVFTGVEVTSCFPESGAKIHVLVYGLNERHLAEINRLRSDLFDLRLYLLERKLPHAVVHATFSVNRRLVYEDLERLILMFDVFEGINGNCTYIHNHTWQESLRNLTPDHIDALFSRHRIEPASRDPWCKGFTGGSDRSCRAVHRHHPHAGGRRGHGCLGCGGLSASSLGQTHAGRRPAQRLLYTGFLHLQDSLRFYERSGNKTLPAAREQSTPTLQSVRLRPGTGLEESVERIYGAIAAFSDTFFNAILESVTRDLTKLDVINFLRKISSSLFGVLMILPHMFDFTPKFYDVLTIKIPSILKSLKIIFELKPEEVVVSTPGPVGLIGLLAARLMSVKLKIIYHSDFAKQIGSMIQDEPTNPVVDAYQRWFHNLADEILVPTRRYIDILEGRGFDPAKLKLFRRGIDISQYFFRESGTRW